MISGLWNGITGLNTFERALAVESNNITNVDTIGHKSDKVSFEDLMYQSRYGKGVSVQSISKDFTQGSLKVTNNDLDVAINGKGFFIVTDPLSNENYYTRAGNFKMGTDGSLQSVDNRQILGLSTTTSNVVSSDNTTIFNKNYSISLASKPITNNSFLQTINAKSTDYVQSAVASGISGDGYKTASAKIADIEILITDYREKLDLYSSNSQASSVSSSSQVIELNYSNVTTNLTNSADFIEVYINGENIRQYFDSDTQTTMNKFADKISTVKGLTGVVDSNGLVSIKSLVPGRDVRVTSATINSNAAGIIETTAPTVGTGIAMVEASRNALQTAIENADASFLDITNTISTTNEDSLTLSHIQLKLDNLGLSTTGFGDLSVEDGVIYSKDGNNKFLIGRIETAYFTDISALEPQGNNLYAQTDLSGSAKYAGSLNVLEGGVLESSNTNLGDGLVDLMVFQRAFEANAKSITTSDEFLKTAIQLKK